MHSKSGVYNLAEGGGDRTRRDDEEGEERDEEEDSSGDDGDDRPERRLSKRQLEQIARREEQKTQTVARHEAARVELERTSFVKKALQLRPCPPLRRAGKPFTLAEVKKTAPAADDAFLTFLNNIMCLGDAQLAAVPYPVGKVGSQPHDKKNDKSSILCGDAMEEAVVQCLAPLFLALRAAHDGDVLALPHACSPPALWQRLLDHVSSPSSSSSSSSSSAPSQPLTWCSPPVLAAATEAYVRLTSKKHPLIPSVTPPPTARGMLSCHGCL